MLLQLHLLLLLEQLLLAAARMIHEDADRPLDVAIAVRAEALAACDQVAHEAVVREETALDEHVEESSEIGEAE